MGKTKNTLGKAQTTIETLGKRINALQNENALLHRKIIGLESSRDFAWSAYIASQERLNEVDGLTAIVRREVEQIKGLGKRKSTVTSLIVRNTRLEYDALAVIRAEQAYTPTGGMPFVFSTEQPTPMM